jgi:hypothetical protein
MMPSRYLRFDISLVGTPAAVNQRRRNCLAREKRDR